MKTNAKRYFESGAGKPKPVKYQEIPDGSSVAGILYFSDGSIYVCANIADLFFTRKTFSAAIKKQAGIMDDVDAAIAKYYGGFEKELLAYAELLTVEE